MHESQEMHGQLTLLLTDQDGRVVQQQQYKNRIVVSGRQLVAELFSGKPSGAPPKAVSHMAVGTDGSKPTDDDGALKAQRSERKAIQEITATRFVENAVHRVRVSFQTVFDFDEANDPNNVPLREAGIFTDPVGGVMYNRVVFDPVVKTNAFKLTLLWDIIF